LDEFSSGEPRIIKKNCLGEGKINRRRNQKTIEMDENCFAPIAEAAVWMQSYHVCGVPRPAQRRVRLSVLGVIRSQHAQSTSIRTTYDADRCR